MSLIIDNFELVSLNSDGFDIRLSFPEPLNVSANENPDLILLQLELGQYKSTSGVNMPESIVKYIEIPAQIQNEAQAEAVDQAKVAT